jgi:hypothetical protein
MHPASLRALLEWLMFMQIGFLLKQVSSRSTESFLAALPRHLHMHAFQLLQYKQLP